MKSLRLFTVILCCFALLSSTTAQKKNSTNQIAKTISSNVRIIKSKPHVFISYERQGKIDPLYGGESGKRVWLRFHNNSRWRVMFCSNPISKEYGETEITYEIERYEYSGETPGTRSSDTCGYLLLETGKSILFSVPLEHVTDGLAIKIQFRYDWETDPDGSDNLLEPKHYAYFYSSDIPKK